MIISTAFYGSNKFGLIVSENCGKNSENKSVTEPWVILRRMRTGIVDQLDQRPGFLSYNFHHHPWNSTYGYIIQTAASETIGVTVLCIILFLGGDIWIHNLVNSQTTSHNTKDVETIIILFPRKLLWQAYERCTKLSFYCCSYNESLFIIKIYNYIA